MGIFRTFSWILTTGAFYTITIFVSGVTGTAQELWNLNLKSVVLSLNGNMYTGMGEKVIYSYFPKKGHTEICWTAYRVGGEAPGLDSIRGPFDLGLTFEYRDEWYSVWHNISSFSTDGYDNNFIYTGSKTVYSEMNLPSVECDKLS